MNEPVDTAGDLTRRPGHDGHRHRLCRADEMATGEAKRFDVQKHRLCVVRIDDDFYVIGDRCTHADISLSEGEVDVENREIECWKHGSTFSLETGEPQCLPAVKPAPVYPVEVVDDEVWVTLS